MDQSLKVSRRRVMKSNPSLCQSRMSVSAPPRHPDGDAMLDSA